MRNFSIAGIFLLLFAAAALAQSATVDVSQAWARATPGKAETGAAYLTIKSADADRLVGVSTPVAKTAALHTMTMEGNVMKMRPLAGLDLPAGQPVTLKPGGTHIMLEGLTAPLKAGENFPLTLQFEKGGTKEVNVAVEQAGAMGPQPSGASAPMSTPASH